MLPDPVTVTAASPTPQLVFSIIKQDGYGSERVDTGGNGYSVIINHSKSATKGTRHYVQMTQTVAATDPITGQTRNVVCSVSFSIARPSFGFTDAAVVALAKALTDFRDDSEVTTAKLVQFQS
ncbi:TPA_asm: coat protein [ssRNA phage Zoerhiza.1_5]|jgi:hypothetical protein|uniref:Coat protein n=2 Tax=Leviviricetes TaxID=2842243 RepID=A0A8S5KXC3_9VIRU|nr:coat protein [ssRNA phage Zoerhiza.1_5]QDH91366.1 MAG: hypothetical protein H1Rhizo25502_000002 [Leviviridae sp.]DAD50230.1 TPA_asm: coat protein [ssRNA phage Zoerhiza.1_5]